MIPNKQCYFLSPKLTKLLRFISAIACVCVLVLTLSACNVFLKGGGKDQGQSGNGSGQQAGGSPAPVATPAIEDVNGFWHPNTFPAPIAETVVTRSTDDGPATAKLQVLSLDSDGTSARMVAAWLPPTSGKALSPEELYNQAAAFFRMPWVRIADFQNREFIEPYQGGKSLAGDDFRNPPAAKSEKPSSENTRVGDCVCSEAPDEVDSTGQPPESVGLIFADFPAPEASEVGLAFGDNAAFFDTVPVSNGKRFVTPELGEFNFQMLRQDSLTDIYGSGAIVARRIPFDVLTESVTDASVSDRGGSSALNVSADVLFDFDSDTLNKGAQKTIDSVAAELKRTAGGQTVTVEGHTDDEGDEAYNQGLSERRATAVKDALEPKLQGSGVSLVTKGFGESSPIVPNRDAKGNAIKSNQAKNRRVSFSYKPSGVIDPNVDTGKRVKDLPEMKPGQSDGGIAAGIVPVPKDGKSVEMNLDVKSVQEHGEFLKLTISLRSASGQDVHDVFEDWTHDSANKQFGTNFTSFYNAAPSLNSVYLWDKKSNLMARVVTAGPAECLCSQAVSAMDADVARGAPTEMYAFFPKKGIESDELVLRVAQTAQLTFDRSAAPQHQAPAPGATSTAGAGAGPSATPTP